jgi:menaquinone-specific isochorismate synthase
LFAVGSQRDEASERAPGQLIVRSVPVPDPGDLLSHLPEPDALAWVRRGDGLVGWGTAARITLPAGEDRFVDGEKWLRELFDSARVDDDVALPGSGPVAFGTFTFDPASDGSVLVVPRTVLGRLDGAAWLTTITTDGDAAAKQPAFSALPGDLARDRVALGPPDAVADPDLRALRPPTGADPGPRSLPPLTGTDPGLRTLRPPTGAEPGPLALRPPTGVRWYDGSLTAPQWEHAVAAAVDAISAGSLRKVVLAIELNATAAENIDSRVLLSRLASRYPDCYTFACAGLVGATPDLYIRRTDSELYSLVLAGTMPRGATPESDEALGAKLLASAKERAEHQYAVADVRSALQPLCGDLRISERPFLLKLANLQHLATHVQGQLAAGEAASHSALALAAALHPTASVCGTPADAAMELIRELESMDRGRYAGPVGWVDARGNGEWGIALRCAEISGHNARLVAGCGIVAGSDPSAELAEARTKFWPMRYALEG